MSLKDSSHIFWGEFEINIICGQSLRAISERNDARKLKQSTKFVINLK